MSGPCCVVHVAGLQQRGVVRRRPATPASEAFVLAANRQIEKFSTLERIRLCTGGVGSYLLPIRTKLGAGKVKIIPV